MTGLEKDFIEYMAKRRNEPLHIAENRYLGLCRRWKGGLRGKEFRKCTSDIQAIYNLFNNPLTEKAVLEAYKSLDTVHLMIYLSSTLPKTFSQRLQSGIALLKMKQYKEFFCFGRRYLKSTIKQKATADLILENISGAPIIVDYGCGMAQLSFDICQKNPSAKVYLVDVDMTISDFTVFRFEKYHYNFERIEITKDNLYPSLPKHNVCIANEVMEHVFEPSRVYDNIHSSMMTGGVLYGNFADHEKHMLHVSPDLSGLRARIASDYQTIETKLYKKF